MSQPTSALFSQSGDCVHKDIVPVLLALHFAGRSISVSCIKTCIFVLSHAAISIMNTDGPCPFLFQESAVLRHSQVRLLCHSSFANWF